MTPEDLFRVRRIGATAWSPDGRYAAVEFSRPGLTLDGSIPTNEIGVIDARAGKLRMLPADAPAVIGYFHPIWSPDGKYLAYLSVDASAVVRPWIWRVGNDAPAPLPDLDARTATIDPGIVWIDGQRLAMTVWDANAEKSGELYFHVLRGRNAAAGWKPVTEVDAPTVTVLESGGLANAPAPPISLAVLNVQTRTRTNLTRGGIHQLQPSGDGRYLKFVRESALPVASYFRVADLETMYSALNFGTDVHVVDTKTAEEVAPSMFLAEERKPASKVKLPLPRPDAGLLSVAPSGEAALFSANASDGSHLWVGSGGTFQEVWSANQWMAGLKFGRPERIEYNGADGAPLTAWLLLPPDYTPGTRLPMVTIAYPGNLWGATPPTAFSPYFRDAEQAQLFAARGYAVLRPSMPDPKDPADAHNVAQLTARVLPAVDAAIARGFTDPDRVALLGQSDGGFATLGIITQTARFRSAIASAGFSDLTSLYGAFYGQYRYGDAGPPQKGQVLRMAQMEKGFSLGGPPWEQAERYRSGSPIFSANQVRTPLMLIHGDMDFIPIQQAEEFFTALYRQDTRAGPLSGRVA